MGRVHMIPIDCPFKACDRETARLKEKANVIIADVHAEATSEKMALGWHLNGKVSAAIGSHTHIQTADERILPGGTAFISDAGACGPRDSIIGMNIESAMQRFLTGLHTPFEVAAGDALVCGCVLDIDESTGQARSITRLAEVVPAAKIPQE
jgi:2',3'-cyclic-nucleotide 2'-phosphodiesterase